MSDYCIPFDMQIEIIKRLPVKPLIRFRSVSKQWKSFIESSEFIKSYGSRHTQPHSCSILSYREYASDDEAKYICFVDDDDNNETLFKVAPSLVVPPQIKQCSITCVVGACHGLLCLYGFAFHKGYKKCVFVIWNPSIGKSLGIVNNTNDICFPTIGFGVCPVTRDPTVVKLTYSYEYTWSVEVFTLSSGVWNVIPSSNSPRQSIQFNNSTHIVIDRFIYWGACEVTYAVDGEYTPNHMLVSFDLITKVFRVLDLPDSLTNELHGRFFMSICKLRDSLVVCGYTMVEEALSCGVWVMEHDSSFRKLLTIGAYVGKILGFRKSGEPICEAWKDGEEPATLDLYDPCSQQIKNLGIIGAKGSFFMGSYKESLLLLDHCKSMEIQLEKPHFVFIHGVGGGSWCWYKVKCLMKSYGYSVTCLDLKSAGIDPSDPNKILSFDEYNKPLIDFLSSLSDHEHVILVGHSAGGLSVTDATHKFPNKISLTVYIAATMLKSGFLTEQDIKDGVPDVSEYGDVYDLEYGLGPDKPPTSAIVKKELQQKVIYHMSPREDVTLATMLLKPGPLYAFQSAQFRKENEGAEKVPRVYIKTLCDRVVKPEQQDKMIAKWPPSNVYVIESDHSPNFSNPLILCDILVEAYVSVGHTHT